jgi:FkbM family methyltransferase
MYSQNDEERWIVNHFAGADPTKSRFLDIGAYDGKTFSNTLRLAELGWAGLCVEPAPSCFIGLLDVHKSNPRVDLLNTAIIPGDSAKMLPFYDSNGDAVSTLVEGHKLRWQGAVKFRKFFTQAMPLFALFEQFGYDYDFINLDVESLNIQLFEELPFPRLDKLKLICVEHDGHSATMTQRLTTHGFRVLTQNPENLIMGR